MDDSTGSAPLGTDEAVQLASAWVVHRASALGIRALLIKGPLAARQGLRKPRVSSDVDLLVEPGGMDALIAHCQRFDWQRRFLSDTPWLMEFHSVTLSHHRWPIDLDIHSYWPGFLSENEAVFEALWSRRETLELAGRPVAVIDCVSHTLLLALHCLRDPARERSIRELPELVAIAARSGAEFAGRAAEMARVLGCLDTAAPFLKAIGAPELESHVSDRKLEAWRLHTRSPANTRAWIVAIREGRVRDRPGILWRAVFPSAVELRGTHPDLPPGFLGLVSGWARRMRTGVSDLGPALLDVLRPGRTRR